MEYHSHCDRGHEWTEENTYTMPSGTKICYACNRSTNWAKAGFPDVFYKFYEFPDAVYTGLDAQLDRPAIFKPRLSQRLNSEDPFPDAMYTGLDPL